MPLYPITHSFTWMGKMMLESFTSRCAMWCCAQKATARTTCSVLFFWVAGGVWFV